MLYICFIYVLSMYYLCIIYVLSYKEYKTKTERTLTAGRIPIKQTKVKISFSIRVMDV